MIQSNKLPLPGGGGQNTHSTEIWHQYKKYLDALLTVAFFENFQQIEIVEIFD